MSDSPKTIPQLHAEAERLRLEIEIMKLTIERDDLRKMAAKLKTDIVNNRTMFNTPQGPVMLGW